MSNPVALKYAQALFQSASEAKQTDAIGNELRGFAAGLAADKELFQFFSSPLVSPDVKSEMLKDASQKLKFSPLFASFLETVASKRRLEAIPDIAESYTAMMKQAEGITQGSVRSAAELTSSQQSELTALIEKVTNQKVELEFNVDQELIGGLHAEVGGWSFDDSITSHISRLKDELKRRAH